MENLIETKMLRELAHDYVLGRMTEKITPLHIAHFTEMFTEELAGVYGRTIQPEDIVEACKRVRHKRVTEL